MAMNGEGRQEVRNTETLHVWGNAMRKCNACVRGRAG